MTPDPQAVNEAITNLSGSYVSQRDVETIAARYDEATAQTVKRIYDRAMDAPADWGDAATSMDTGLRTMHERLETEFPWLGPEAQQRLGYMFMMTWK